MSHITFQNRLRYKFDNTFSKGPRALIGWLFLLSVLLIALMSLFIFVTGIDPDNRGFFEIMWASLTRTLNPGAMGRDAGSWGFLFSMLTVTIIGIFIVSILIGLLTKALEGKLLELRKGRTFVAETGHTVILGWSSQLNSILSELVHANANLAHATIAILANVDKVEMEDEIRAKLGDTGATRIVCRTGNPLDLNDLKIINPYDARSIIVLTPDENEAPDAHVLKTILALTNDPNRPDIPYHIVAGLRDRQKLAVTKMIGEHEVELVLAEDVIARITAQTSYQSGLSVAYTELLNFEGNEIYFKEEANLVGKPFGQALLAYEESALIGLHFKDGRVKLNPPMGQIIEQGDKIIAISEDDDTMQLSPIDHKAIDMDALQKISTTTAAPIPQHSLMLGWNHLAPAILKELDNYVPARSTVTVVTDHTIGSNDAATTTYNRLTVSFEQGDTTNRRILDALPMHRYHNITLLSEKTDELDAQQADAHTIITLLHLRDIADRKNHTFSIVTEMLDTRNLELAKVTRANDFIVSDRLISLMLSQIAESKERAPVFQDLFDAEGAELYLKPATEYIQLGKTTNFYTIVEAARRRNETAVGYRLHTHAYDPTHLYGVKLNPPKSNMMTFSEEDRIIVLADR